jgi:ketosteroid isomerase-like protein
MTQTASPALEVALACFRAWTGHDLDGAMSHIADDIVCDAPAGRIEGAVAYRDFMAPFVRILTGSELIAAFGDETTAVIVYDTQTVPVKSAPAAECVTAADGKITRSRFIFDRLPFQAGRKTAT